MNLFAMLTDSSLSWRQNRLERLQSLECYFSLWDLQSALFSMGQNYGPGESQFWVYWVVAIPLVCLAFMGLYFGLRMVEACKDAKVEQDESFLSL